MAIAYDEKNKTALFIGGFSDWNYQFSTFKPSDDVLYGAFYGKSRTYLKQFSNGVTTQMLTYGQAQYYTTLEDTIWTITAGTGLNKFNLKTWKGEHTPISIPQSTDAGGTACLASHTHYLFVIGGYVDSTIKWINTVQIYDIETDKWLNGVPSLNKTRGNLACVTVDDTLYAIAGNGHDGYLKSIEILDISGDLKSIQSQEWQMLNAQLRTALAGIRAVTYGEHIITVGGMTANKDVSSDINVINTKTETVDYGSLVVAVKYTAPIIIDHTLYVFGGKKSNGYGFSNYQYLALHEIDRSSPERSRYPSVSPTTAAPSIKEPSATPTARPTRSPSSRIYTANQGATSLTYASYSYSAGHHSCTHHQGIDCSADCETNAQSKFTNIHCKSRRDLIDIR
eukprot:171755_1